MAIVLLAGYPIDFRRNPPKPMHLPPIWRFAGVSVGQRARRLLLLFKALLVVVGLGGTTLLLILATGSVGLERYRLPLMLPISILFASLFVPSRRSVALEEAAPWESRTTNRLPYAAASPVPAVNEGEAESSIEILVRTFILTISPYVRVARPDHWIKNIFILSGCVIAWQLSDTSIRSFWPNLLIGFVAACLLTSANYVINEWLDREFDQYHPVKKFRPSVAGQVNRTAICVEYAVLAIIGLLLASLISRLFSYASIFLLIMGFVYNVKPFRAKDRVYLDVLSESINNPCRLLLGWFMVSSHPFPPSSLIVAYWMGGAYLMGVKRLSEYKYIGAETAGLYRRSFRYYTEERLLISSLFYALLAASMGGVFLVKHKVELVITLPLFALMFAWYFFIGLKPNSAAQHPEQMHEERAFLMFVFLVGIVSLVCIKIRIPFMEILLRNAFLPAS